ncbi:hypothetical protein BKA62DRAFT_491670 [Auriculariales sp. MPI-PUGE-AT-0066]|nr:hypothetical protein BKA62DRAFT_491670 [Auriculariales sp. MPI-PUGE-AT-0066]
MSESNRVTHFLPIFLPVAGIIAPAARPDLATATLLSGAVARNAPADTIANYKAAMEAQAATITLSSRPAVNQWLANAFNALNATIVAVPEDERQSVLFLVTTPEFALNGFNQDNGIAAWNCQAVIPESLRQYAQDQIAEALMPGANCRLPQPNPPKAPIKYNILFTFTCSAYADGPVEMVEKIETIDGVTTVKDTPKTIRKRAPNYADQMRLDFGLSAAWEAGPVAAAQIRPHSEDKVRRDQEVNWTTPFRTLKQPLKIGFASCEDIQFDAHPDVNLVVISSSSVAFFRFRFVPEIGEDTWVIMPFLLTTDFLLNDQLSWNTEPVKFKEQDPSVKDKWTTSQLYAAGFYQRNKQAPGNWKPSVADKVKAQIISQNRTPVNGRSTLADEMAEFYNIPPSDSYNFPGVGAPPIYFTSSTVAEPNPVFMRPRDKIAIPFVANI